MSTPRGQSSITNFKPANSTEFHAAAHTHDRVEVGGDVQFKNTRRRRATNDPANFVQRLVRIASRSESVGARPKVRLVDGVEQAEHRLLDDLILQRGDRDGPLSPVLRIRITDSHFNGARLIVVGSVVWGQASIFGGKGLFRTLVVVLPRRRRRQGGRARSGGRAQARASPAARTGERRR